MKHRHFLLFLLFLFCRNTFAQQTERQYLSGTGLGNTVTWQFRCSEGRNSGRWSKIEVPSQWELQGFGEYTYGRWYKKKGVKNPSMEEGIYRRSFKVPAAWKGKNIRVWFDGVMTDTDVLINGVSAGETHRGGFYRFSYDVTQLLKYGSNNRIEVRVKKHSDNKSVNAAERKADWWLFGGIYRPVWLEAKPELHIERIAVDARADGVMNLDVQLQGATGKERLQASLSPVAVANDKTGDMTSDEAGRMPVRQNLNNAGGSIYACHWKDIEPWTPESPRLYTLTVSLLGATGETIHSINTRIGFRTVEFRPRDGIYLNGTKLVMKGINRHSFHPDGGRTTNKEISLQDALLIKEMNMNAVRSHYPPDEHFLDACDSLGLLYIDELAGWQNAYDTPTGSKLLKEMITRDVNHPCIVLWSNGNEGGWNTAVDSLFRAYDPQRRHVIHPWADFDELDTHHYPAYLTGVGRFTNGYKVFMPTEFMHGQYDQGHGAGLEDFWARYTAHPLFAGGFMWAYSDEAVRRADLGGKLDSADYNAPDGILGPYREKEGSYYAVREIWSPLYIAPLMITPSFNGKFLVANRHLFTNLRDCRMRYRVYRCPSPLQGVGEACAVADSGAVQLPSLSPGETGYAELDLPMSFFENDVLELEAYGADGQSLCIRTFPISYAGGYLRKELAAAGIEKKPAQSVVRIEETDSLITLRSPAVDVTFRRKDATIASIVRNADGQIIPLKDGPLPVGMKMELVALTARAEQGGDAVLTARYRGGADSIVWRLQPDGLLEMDAVLLNRASGGGGFDDAFTDEAVLNFGLTFSYPEAECTGMRWMGRGPYRVWKNRIPGTNYGIWQKDYNNTITGESTDRLVYPEFKGYHANLYWATIQSSRSPFTVYSATDGVFLRVFTPEEPHGRQDGIHTMPDFPSGDISFLLDIPAIRSFKPVSQHGPQSQPGIIRIKKGDEGLRMRLVFSLAPHALLADTCAQAQPIAFPGAEGYGKYTTGGRGGRVLTVTNLNDSGPGSLREAVEQTGPRIVVFAVDGTIELKSQLRINNDSITIAGQSAPGDGICIKDYPLVVNASNVIIRYIRVRVGDRHQQDSDALGGGRYGQKNVILDHLSVSWSIDECLSIYKTENLTVQWCMIAHSLNTSVHTKGSHGFGGIWGGYKATFHHNLLANHASRNPRFASVDGTKWVDYRNNVVYNWGFKTAYGGGHHAEINMVGNYYKPGPASQHRRLLDVAADGTGRYYVAGNVMEGDDVATADNRSAVTDCAGKPYIRNRKSAAPDSGISPDAIPTLGEACTSCLVDSPFPYEPIKEDTPVAAYQRVLESVGCSFSQDDYDREVLRQVKEGLGTFGTNGIINSQEDVGGWPALKIGTPLTDSDADGMPDVWELRHGLNPKDASDASTYAMDKDFTNVEVYLNSLVP